MDKVWFVVLVDRVAQVDKVALVDRVWFALVGRVALVWFVVLTDKVQDMVLE